MSGKITQRIDSGNRHSENSRCGTNCVDLMNKLIWKWSQCKKTFFSFFFAGLQPIREMSPRSQKFIIHQKPHCITPRSKRVQTATSVCVSVWVCGLMWVSLCDVMSRLDNIPAVFRSAEQNASCCEFDEVPPLSLNPYQRPPPPLTAPRGTCLQRAAAACDCSRGEIGTGPYTMCRSSIHHHIKMQRMISNCLFAWLSFWCPRYFLRSFLMLLSSLLYVCVFMSATCFPFIWRRILTSAKPVADIYRSSALTFSVNNKLESTRKGAIVTYFLINGLPSLPG